MGVDGEGRITVGRKEGRAGGRVEERAWMRVDSQAYTGTESIE